MKLVLHIGAFFLTLFGVDFLCNAAHNALVAQYVAHIERGAWWPEGYAALETMDLLLYAMAFGIVGSLIVRFLGYPQGILFSFALGLTYSLVAFAQEPNLPSVRYSHAPAWLWVLSWSQFYMPALACALAAHGSYAFQRLKSGRTGAG